VSVEETDLALPILGWGIAGGLLGSLSCCCWFGPAAAGWMAGRQAGADGGAKLGLGVGLVSGLMVSSLGTALFLVTSDPDLMGEMGAGELPLGGLAAGYAILGFGVSFAGAALGTLLGTGGAAESGGSVEASSSALRFLEEVPSADGPPPFRVDPPVAPQASEPAAVTPTEGPSAPDAAAPAAPQNDKTPAVAGAVEVDSADLTSSEDEKDAWD
jgi:hypothetical protein